MVSRFKPAYASPKIGDMELPPTIEAISSEWLTQALAVKHPGVAVEDFRIEEVIHGTTTKIRLSLDYNSLGRAAGLPPRMILKGAYEPHSVPARDMYVNEVLFYRDVAPTLLHDPGWMRRVFDQLRQIQDSQDVCVIHGDTHLGNLYEEVDGTPGFFDAQVSRASWSLEVAYHIIAALDVADRPRYEKALLAHYLDRLRVNGVDAPDFPGAWDLYMWSAAYGFFIFLINETRFQTEAVNTAYSVRFASVLLDHGIPGLV